MTQAAYTRSILTQLAAAAVVVIVLGIFGPWAALAVCLFGGCFVGVLMILAAALDGEPTDVDEWCSKVDQELDQELAARRALRVQNTVQAQVIPFPQRRRTDGAA